MKLTMKKLSAALMLLMLQAPTHAGPGNLFGVTASGTPVTLSITLCLNAKAQLSCQTYTVTGSTLDIRTLIPNHTYPDAGIKINTPGYSSSPCVSLANGFCSFSASNTGSTTINVSGNSGSNNIVFVGNYNNGSNQMPLGYTSTNSGGTFSLSDPISLPSGLGASESGVLFRAACDSTMTWCTTVGYYYDGSTSLPLTYVSSNGGHTWVGSNSLPALPGGGVSGVLRDVRCSSTGTQCAAIGNYSDGSSSHLLGYKSTDGGNSWTSSSFNTPPLAPPTNIYLQSVACSSSGNICTAVGYYFNSNATPMAYYSTNGGGTWTLSSAIPLPLKFVNQVYLNGVACDSSGSHCSAVGYYYDGSVSHPLTYTSSNSGASWTASATQPAMPPGAVYAYLNSIACDTTGNLCTAVGSYYNGSIYQPLAYTSANGGASWTLSATLPPLPPGAANGFLYVVACNSTRSACSAGGRYYNGSTDTSLAYTSADGGVTWLLSSPQPALPGGGTDGMIGDEVT